jgi:DNA-directed RNA polymerase specialized sigma24 family protein
MQPGTSSPLGRFQVTPVTLWRDAAGPDPSKAREAVEQLCAKYRAPIYSFVRGRGFSTHDAEDITQGFFAEFIGRERYKSADPARGRLRTFLLTCVKNYMSNRQRALDRGKRGGPNLEMIPLPDGIESVESMEFADFNTPQLEYERKWAATVIAATLSTLRAEMAMAGQEELFRRLRPYIGEKSNGDYAAIAADLGVLESSLRVTISRFRARYREISRAEILQTVSSPEDVEDEVGYLISLFSRDRRG